MHNLVKNSRRDGLRKVLEAVLQTEEKGSDDDDDDEVGCGDDRCLRVARGVVYDLALFSVLIRIIRAMFLTPEHADVSNSFRFPSRFILSNLF